ncbi:CopM family metallochaperone, partial [Moraxella catarrhalis]|uniref:CopM family metallochaperone n=1 Tax=Moraxella catarrhalis TaxID=480 RepID=UPI00128E4EB4
QPAALAQPDTVMPMAARTGEYMQSMNTMHVAMMAAATKAHADVAFVEGMIPHLQGAIQMAQIELKDGKDAAMRKLAQDIIDSQQTEIEVMQNWLTTAQDKDAIDANSEHGKAYLSDMSIHDAMMTGVH